MTQRQRFFDLLSGRRPEPALFFPDITDWYAGMRIPPGEAREQYGAGRFIGDDAPIHTNKGLMPAQFADFTFLDFYRRFNWGLPIHAYKWYDTHLDGVEKSTQRQGNQRTTTWRCSAGTLTERHDLAGDGSWAPLEHPVKNLDDLKVMRYIVEHTRYTPRFDILGKLMADIGEMGVCDVVLQRSPFGKLVHMYMGFETVIYQLFDDPAPLEDFMAFQEEHDLEVVRMAAAAPAKLVIMSDHTDESLISPTQYRQYCMPHYQKVNAILHAAGKQVSTHLDGNIRGYLPYLKETGFDLLDGCTPAPMTNYQVEDLAAAMPAGMYAWCGVPATLFCQNLPDKEILDYGRRILDIFGGKVILNVGDILPPNGNIGQTIKLGELAGGM